MNDMKKYDVAIIGGGAAGLSGAVALARSLRSVIVVDGGEPRNAPAAGAHNLLGQEGIAPGDLVAAGRREAEGYGAEIRHDGVAAVRRTDSGFDVDLAGGGTITARRILLATGITDELPDVPGVRGFWGRSVLHCPYCHGWEVQGKRIGVLGTSPAGMHQALLFRQLSDNVTLFRHTMPPIEDDDTAKLSALGIRVVDGAVRRLAGEGDSVSSVIVDDGEVHAVDAVVVAPRFVARADLYVQLGGSVTDHPMGEFIETGPMGRTEIPGVWAAGNVSDLSAMITVAAGAGLQAGAAINADLVTEEADRAVREDDSIVQSAMDESFRPAG